MDTALIHRTVVRTRLGFEADSEREKRAGVSRASKGSSEAELNEPGDISSIQLMAKE